MRRFLSIALPPYPSALAVIAVRAVTRAALAGSAALAMLAASPRPAAGQPIFIGAGALANIERTARASGTGIPDNNADGTAPGGMLEMGVYLTPRLSARVEWSMTSWLDFDAEPIVYPLAATLVGPGDTVPSIIGVRFEGRRQTKAGVALLGYHVGPRRASVQLLGGLGFLAQTTRTTYSYRGGVLSSLLPFPRYESTTTLYDPVGVVGVDAAVALTDHASVVPQFRVFASNGILRTRPALGIRWTF